jgi:hypothetical protein
MLPLKGFVNYKSKNLNQTVPSLMFIPQDSTTKKQLETEKSGNNHQKENKDENAQITIDFLSEFCDVDI